MNKIELIKAEIERLKGQLIRGACSSQVCMETHCKEEAYNEVLAFIDSLLLNEEPIDYEYNGGEKSTLKWNQLTTEDLVAEGLADAHGFIKNPEFKPAKYSWRAVRDVFIEGVKAGAQWQKGQKPIGGSEEDEKVLTEIINSVNGFDAFTGIVSQNFEQHERKINWLKSLRPQPHWKPSSEQMEALKRVFYNRPIGSAELNSLESLYNDLKKL